ncbi:MAG TPA: choice-of-anchor tandem repeat GloVer-containing protein [Acetobacteraceae bacterium]|nr:choice-of-anchor tandem repeat GloVer-containing protein [Acetobacteraceae bacterium]
MKAIGITVIVGATCGVLSWQFPAVAAATKETVVYSFCSGGAPQCTDGAGPTNDLTAVNGMLYGATGIGGVAGSGVLFALNPRTGAEQVLHSFGDGVGSLIDPLGSLIHVEGKLYGTASSGGYGAGGLFAYDLSSGRSTTVYSFCRRTHCPDGYQPLAGLINSNGVLYGTTFGGGARGQGVIFAFNLKTGVETVLHSFGLGNDGQRPEAGLLDVNGTLYGTTFYGGDYPNGGTLFLFDLKTGTESVLHSFGSGTDGAGPKAAVIDVNGTLYGTTWQGGTDNDGTVFSIDPSTGAETVLHSFNNTDGQWPVARLINVKGVLYGTSFYGGAYQTCGDSAGCGTVFSLDPATGVETVLHSFSGTDGAVPDSGLIQVHGKFYGVTSAGGASGEGTVFRLGTRSKPLMQSSKTY